MCGGGNRIHTKVSVGALSLDAAFFSIRRVMFVELHSFLLTGIFLQGTCMCVLGDGWWWWEGGRGR